jgi:hypothetical protein
VSQPTPTAVTRQAKGDRGYSVAEYFRTLPPRLTIKKYCEVRQCCRSYVYVLARLGRIRIVKDGRKSYVDTTSAIDDMMSLPEAGARGQ